MTEDPLAEELSDGPVLTNRQAQVEALLKRGASKHEVAEELDLTLNTVENHMTRANKRIRKAREVLDLLDTLEDPREMTDPEDRMI